MAAILKAISELNVSPFEASMGRIEKRVKKFSTGDLKRMGSQIGAMFSIYAVGRFISEMGKTADEIDNISKATGASRENLQALTVLFEEGGRSGSEILQVLGRLRKNLEEASVNEEYARSIQKLGISFEEVTSLGADKIFEKIAKALRENAGNAEMGEAAGNLLGRSYSELAGVMNDLAVEGLDPLRERLLSVSQIMGEDAVKAANKLEERYSRLSRTTVTTLRKWALAAGGAVSFVATYWGSGGDKSIMYPAAQEDAADPAKAARQAASAAAMRAMLTKRRDAAIASANQWFAQQSGKVNVGAVKSADSLASVGGFIGGQSSPAAKAAERMLKIAELHQQQQDRIAKATESCAIATAKAADSLEE